MRSRCFFMVKKQFRNIHINIKRLFVISIFLILTGATYIAVDQCFNFVLIGDDVVEIDVNKKYLESGTIANFLGNKIDNVETKSNLDVTKIGEYEIDYSCNVLFFKKELKRKILVKDLEKPTIELEGEKDVYLNIGEEYKDSGYKAYDNVDGDITQKVSVKSDLDINKVGQYKMKYTIKDSSNNKSTAERNIEVINRDTILKSSVANFKLDGLFTDVLLEYNENNEYDYYKDVTFLGDSNVVFLYQNGQFVPANQTWGKFNLNIAQINSSTFTTFINGRATNINDALSTYKPKFLIASIGINTVLYMDKDQFLKESQALINNIRTNHPETKLIFSAVFPLYSGTISSEFQYRINQYNYYLLELCHKNKINFINFSDRIKDGNGLADRKYYECTSNLNCGFHLNSEGKKYYIDYIKHLDLGRN